MSVLVLSGNLGTTTKITADDTSNALIADGGLSITQDETLADGAGNSITRSAVLIGALITCEENDIRFGFGTPGTAITVTASLGHILYVGQSIKLTSAIMFRSFRYINKTAAANGVLMVTPEYSKAGGAR